MLLILGSSFLAGHVKRDRTKPVSTSYETVNCLFQFQPIEIRNR